MYVPHWSKHASKEEIWQRWSSEKIAMQPITFSELWARTKNDISSINLQSSQPAEFDDRLRLLG